MKLRDSFPNGLLQNIVAQFLAGVCSPKPFYYCKSNILEARCVSEFVFYLFDQLR